MSLVDDARWLTANRPRLGGSRTQKYRNGACFYCGENMGDEPHEPQCPWLAVPRIVAVLEITERVLLWEDGLDPGILSNVGYLDDLRKAMRGES